MILQSRIKSLNRLQQARRLHLQWLLLLLSWIACVSALSHPSRSRRSFIAFASGAVVVSPFRQPSDAETNNNTQDTSDSMVFQTLGYGQEEYTNSITASRDTNISPREAYDVIRERIPKARSDDGSLRQRVLDVGAGAGVSTSVLYNELGYKEIDAVDWSAVAWDDNVVTCPESVKFYAQADDIFFEYQAKSASTADAAPLASPTTLYSVICYNFAVNFRKAERVARQHLSDDGILLAPVNDKADYWYKQTYVTLNKQGKILWKGAAEVGAWSVQFQPDVTSDTCTGIWCRGFNGFR